MKQNLSTSRMERIRKISQMLKAMILFYFVVFGVLVCIQPMLKNSVVVKTPLPVTIYGVTYADASAVPTQMQLWSYLGSGLLLWAMIVFYRLLNLYEKGMFFSSANVLQFKRLGYLAVAYGMCHACAPIMATGELVFAHFLLVVIGSPWIIPGFFIVMMAWIMDEGRKIQEEQALTV